MGQRTGIALALCMLISCSEFVPQEAAAAEKAGSVEQQKAPSAKILAFCCLRHGPCAVPRADGESPDARIGPKSPIALSAGQRVTRKEHGQRRSA